MAQSTTTSTSKGSKASTAYAKAKAALENGAAEDTPSKRQARERSKTVIANSSKKSPESVIKSLAEIKLSTQETIDSISNQIAAELTALKEVQEAVAAEQENLKALHRIAAEANTLEALLLAQDEQRQKWTLEVEQKRKEDAEYNADLAKRRKWEQEQYSYETNKRRKAEEDQWQEQMTAQRAKFQEALDMDREALETRATELKKSEDELSRLRADAAKFDERLDVEVKKNVAIATNSLKKDLTHEHALAKLALENQLSLKNSELEASKGRVVELVKLNTELEAKYREASDKVQKIAERAIDGASKQAVVVQTPTAETTSTGRSR